MDSNTGPGIYMYVSSIAPFIYTYFCVLYFWFKHILLRRKGLGAAYNATEPSPEVFLDPGYENLIRFV